MDKNYQLPEGYTPIEYIEYRPKQEQFFAFGQFERFKEALELAKRINASFGNDVCKITNIQIPEIDKRLENEFRLLWIVDNINKNQDIFVTIPHPEAYCRLIDNSINK